ncbi:hypothetical protein LMG27174_06742 [Paraburkholderia rhynchosiae]|uniref:Uncharacterized protein n=1 Tax=Paraburkholderia rhynchosiae TaxID=487049 RepID=A0A6J5CQ33_9BURK|nr:hypothetical protein LMG27174_06742 [Paraburkholderia rhynchosiae]
MLSRPPIAEWIASAFRPPRNRVLYEALFYGCMPGIVMPAQQHVASGKSPHDDVDAVLSNGPAATPDTTSASDPSLRSMS